MKILLNHCMKAFWKALIIVAIASSGISAISARQSQKPEEKKGMELKAQRRYDLIVSQNNDTLRFNRNLRTLRGNKEKLNNRNLISDLLSGYLSLGTSTLLNASQSLIETGISYIKESARDKRPDWQKAAMGENRFVKKLPMVTEILDFYGSPSTRGALDPTDMQFNGFGCRQYMTLIDSEGNPYEKEVFYISCKVRDDDAGISRILNHSKFQMEVDELRFDPFWSDLPNDTLSVIPDTRYEFNFDSRKDLRFQVKAKIFSSWINEAIQVNKDVLLGEFVITSKIDPDKLDTDGVFRYSKSNPDDSIKFITITGDSFLVPRSYVGSTDMKNQIPSWGTGQYRVEMEIEESCNINENYYLSEDGKKWRKERWKPEWQKMKKRPNRSKKQNLVEIMFPQFTGQQWITTLVEPTITVLLKNEKELVTKGAILLQQSLAEGSTTVSGAPSSTKPQYPQGN